MVSTPASTRRPDGSAGALVLVSHKQRGKDDQGNHGMDRSEGVEITEEEKGRLLDALKALEEDAEQEGRNLVLRSLRRLGRRDAAKADFERAANLAATEADRRFLAKQIEELAEKGSLMPPGGADAR